jgi:hypothetical protein
MTVKSCGILVSANYIGLQPTVTNVRFSSGYRLFWQKQRALKSLIRAFMLGLCLKNTAQYPTLPFLSALLVPLKPLEDSRILANLAM